MWQRLRLQAYEAPEEVDLHLFMLSEPTKHVRLRELDRGQWLDDLTVGSGVPDYHAPGEPRSALPR
jgi:hypothetical protein